MADLPYPLSSDNLSEFRSQMLDTFKDLYENRIGGASVGDVFTNANDVLELKVAEGSGLFKNDDDELDFKVTASTISNTPAGNVEAETVQGAINELAADKLQTGEAPHLQAFYMTEGDTTYPPTVSGYISLFVGVSPFFPTNMFFGCKRDAMNSFDIAWRDGSPV